MSAAAMAPAIPESSWRWILTLALADLPHMRYPREGHCSPHPWGFGDFWGRCQKGQRQVSNLRAVCRMFRDAMDELATRFPNVDRAGVATWSGDSEGTWHNPIRFGFSGTGKVCLDKGLPYAFQILHEGLAFFIRLKGDSRLARACMSMHMWKDFLLKGHGTCPEDDLLGETDEG